MTSGPNSRAVASDVDVLPFDVVPRRGGVRAGRVAETAKAGKAAKARKGAKVAASALPVARVAVDVALAHLDRPFDYLVPETLAAQAVSGTRVRVRFAGQLVDGFVIERVESSEHAGRLAFLERVVSPEVVLTPLVLAAARAVADRWAGTLADVLRLAVPPRHARVEGTPSRPLDPEGPARHARSSGLSTPWRRYRAGERLVASLRGGGRPRAVWAALPGGGWAAEIAGLAAAAVGGGRGVLILVPDGGAAATVGAEVESVLGDGAHVVLTADLGPAERYRRFLAVSRGEVRVVVGTRAAAFAPVAGLGLVVVWDDGSDLHAEPRAPYPHAREISLLRGQIHDAAVVVGGHAVTAEGARLVATGWAKAVVPERATIRAVAPRVVSGEDAAARAADRGARLPTIAWQAAHDALMRKSPVLVQVPRGGYLPALSCDRCRTPLRCAFCSGPLTAGGGDAGGAPSCSWCGRLAAGWRCPECGGARYRAVLVGARRTAEELGRAFPGVAVRTSAGEDVVARVPAGPTLVIATPGAEPVVDGGYGAALLLDGWAMLSRADLRVGEETLRRWLNAASLVRPASDGGVVVVLADPGLRPVQALIRWDPLGHAERELADRVALGFPPAAVFAELTGEPEAVSEMLATLESPEAATVLGPVAVSPPHRANPAREGATARALIRAPRAAASELAASLARAQGVRSARKLTPVRVRIDPIDIG